MINESGPGLDPAAGGPGLAQDTGLHKHSFQEYFNISIQLWVYLNVTHPQAFQESFQTKISLEEQEEVKEPQEEEVSFQGSQPTLQVQVIFRGRADV